MAQRVYLNIGGSRFETYVDVLQRIPYFNAQINVEGSLTSSEEKPIFVDRDGKAFRHVLNWARDPEWDIPQKYYSELAWWGLQIEDLIQTTKVLNHCETLKSNTENAIGQFYTDYFTRDPDITMHVRARYNRATLCLYQPTQALHASPNWSITLESGAYRDFYLIMPSHIPYSDYKLFTVKIVIGCETIKYSLDCAPYYYKTIQRIDNYNYIPLYVLPSHHECLIPPPYQPTTISLSCTQYSNLATGIIWEHSKLGSIERDQITTQSDQVVGELVEHNICTDVHLSTGYLTHILWHTDAIINEVILIDEYGNKRSYDRAMFEFLEPNKICKPRLPEGWGLIQISMDPENMTHDSGGLIVNPKWTLQFPDAVTGTAWQFNRQIGIHFKGMFKIYRPPQIEPS